MSQNAIPLKHADGEYLVTAIVGDIPVDLVIDSGSVSTMLGDQNCKAKSCPVSAYIEDHPLKTAPRHVAVFGSQTETYHWTRDEFRLGKNIFSPSYEFGAIDSLRITDGVSTPFNTFGLLVDGPGKSFWSQMPTVPRKWSIRLGDNPTLVLGDVDKTVPIIAPLLPNQSMPYYIIPSTLNGTKYQCIVDTGATASYFPSSLAHLKNEDVTITLGNNPSTQVHLTETIRSGDNANFTDILGEGNILLGNTWMKGRTLNFNMETQTFGISS
tara:strand:- start:239 stop:1045 length:807 start_codon:yes stop_codon:yes gene_type:complete